MTSTGFFNATSAQRLALLFLRIATGFLLVWGGLNKLLTGKAPFAVGRTFELDATMDVVLGYSAGGAQLLIGTLCVLGLWRRAAFASQAVIHGFTAASVRWAIVDPYRWYIADVDRIVFNSHLFYPTIITFAACILLIAFRPYDALALDRILGRRIHRR